MRTNTLCSLAGTGSSNATTATPLSATGSGSSMFVRKQGVSAAMPSSNAVLAPDAHAIDQPHTSLRDLLTELSRRGIGTIDGEAITGITVGSPEAEYRPTTFSDLLALLERQAQATLTFQVDA